MLSTNAASVELGATQPLQASVQSQGRPDRTVRWSVAGASCPYACGTVDVNGNYTAPTILPSSPTVALTATSVADASKQNTATLTIMSHFALQISAPANLPTGASTSLVATLTPAPGSNPSPGLSWSLQGAGCTGSACGVLTPYTAPLTAPQPNTVLITVTQADATKAVQANVTIPQNSSIGITPANATLAANHRLTLTAALGGDSGGAFTWTVSGIAGGNSAVGQICVTSSRPCQPLSSGTATQVDYVAPGAIPSPNPVIASITSATNAALTASAQTTILNHLVVSVLPNNVTHPASVFAGGLNGFTLQVDGSGFVTGSSGAGSTLIIGGTTRVTNCATTNACTAPITIDQCINNAMN